VGEAVHELDLSEHVGTVPCVGVHLQHHDLAGGAMGHLATYTNTTLNTDTHKQHLIDKHNTHNIDTDTHPVGVTWSELGTHVRKSFKIIILFEL
jgi:hypothetical protein